MFTGIITAAGRILANEQTSNNERALSVLAPLAYKDVVLGESIAVNGVCLTVTQKSESVSGARLHFFVSAETCERSNLGDTTLNMLVNMERAMAAGERFSGHIVQGHVDGRAHITHIANSETSDASHLLRVKIPQNLDRYLVEKGSVTLDGISLTVNSIKDFELYLTIIPHTWQHTNLHAKQVGQDLNLEVDVVAKYVEKLTSAYHS